MSPRQAPALQPRRPRSPPALDAGIVATAGPGAGRTATRPAPGARHRRCAPARCPGAGGPGPRAGNGLRWRLIGRVVPLLPTPPTGPGGGPGSTLDSGCRGPRGGPWRGRRPGGVPPESSPAPRWRPGANRTKDRWSTRCEGVGPAPNRGPGRSRAHESVHLRSRPQRSRPDPAHDHPNPEAAARGPVDQSPPPPSIPTPERVAFMRSRFRRAM